MITFPPVSLLDWLIFLVVAAGSLMVLISVLKFIWRPAPKPPFQQKPLFSAQQLSALKLIDEAMAGQVRVFANVSVAQLMTLNPKLSKSQRELASQQLYGEALDFILCSPHDLKVRATVLLAEPGLSKKEQRKQQQFWHALRAAGLPVIELCARNWPSPNELRCEILTACKAPSPAPQASTRLGTARVEPVFSPLDNEPSIEDNEPVIKISAND